MIFHQVEGLDAWLPLISGLMLLMVLLVDPSGLCAMNVDMAHQSVANVRRLLGRPGRRSRGSHPRHESAEVLPVESRSLEVRDLTVRFGGVTHWIR